MSGRLVVFEGGDGVGKTTQARRLEAFLKSRGVKCTYLKYPDRTTCSGQIIDSYLKGQIELDCHTANLVLVSNLWEIAGQIEALLSQGAVVIVDRYRDTNAVYSVARGCTLDEAMRPCVGLPEPDTIFFLDLAPELAMARKTGPLEVLETCEFQTKVYRNYKSMGRDSWMVIDASRSPDDVANEIQKFFE